MPKLPARQPAPRRERDVQSDVRETLSSMRGVVHWRNNVGSLQDASGRWVQYGLCDGSADLIACVPTQLTCTSCGAPLPPLGRFVGLEVKGPTSRVTPAQIAWQRVVEGAHGVAGIVREPLEAVELVQRARTRW